LCNGIFPAIREDWKSKENMKTGLSFLTDLTIYVAKPRFIALASINRGFAT